MMEKILILSHSWIRWILIILIFVVLVKSYKGWRKNKAFAADDNKYSLMLMIFADIQLLLGIVLMFVSPYVKMPLDTEEGMRHIQRFWTMEHSTMMILAIVLIHLGRSFSKKAGNDQLKHKRLFLFTLVAVFFILAAIPWPGMPLIGRSFINLG
jgi:cation transport ATPase